jgi:hypothetical protein
MTRKSSSSTAITSATAAIVLVFIASSVEFGLTVDGGPRAAPMRPYPPSNLTAHDLREATRTYCPSTTTAGVGTTGHPESPDWTGEPDP